MDQIWKDINLISSLHRPNAATTSPPVFGILAPPPSFSKVNPMGCRICNPQPPTTTLNLSSGSPDSRNINPTPASVCGHSFKNKRPAETETDQEDHSADDRFKRMIKNRESAARSRDRKHAYTYDLEVEVARLKKENAKLRKQQQMWFLPAPPPAQLPKKATLRRTLTAPF